MRHVLLLDDEINVLYALKRTLRQCFPTSDFRISLFTDPEQALLRSADLTFDIVISDYKMPGMNGADFLQIMKKLQPDAVRVVLSASIDIAEVMDSVNRAEVFRYIAKPWTAEELKKTFELAFARRDEAIEVRRLATELRVMLGELTPQELEATRLEAEEPGITQVNWGSDGSVHLS
jgi:two-component system probable response regulator PhcQ